jgi:L-Ala-D/L-Glu epimerase
VVEICTPALETVSMTIIPTKMDVFQTTIPMRSFKHAAAERKVAQSALVRVTFADGTVGWGETLPRPYVTGETFESVFDDLEHIIWPRWAGQEMAREGEPAEIAEPMQDGRCINAAIAAFDMACMHRLGALPEVTSQQMLSNLAGRTQARREIDVRVSAVLGASNRKKIRRKVRLMRWGAGLDDFKLKLTGEDAVDAELLQTTHHMLKGAIARGQATLRVDVNGGWSREETPERIRALLPWGVCAVEQPTYCSSAELVELSRDCALPLIADESMLTMSDAETLLAEPERIWWNLRLSKNGGLVNTLKLAKLAGGRGVTFVLGCMVGETGILSAIQRRFLQLGAGPRFLEGNYGKFLLRDDLTSPSLKFSYGGKIKTLREPGLGVTVREDKLAEYAKHLFTLEAH